ncbi:hypothetical protein A0H81_08955 [Grifola frondosa]|uniref:Uncharacterized protein n=1 Tax=Grifola frondosa TaxID=5627 RepID=A0A1C7M3Q9_GRIFR|nr:hypothetical protein A0H81_08955 [Grifola frondosa]
MSSTAGRGRIKDAGKRLQELPSGRLFADEYSLLALLSLAYGLRIPPRASLLHEKCELSHHPEIFNCSLFPDCGTALGPSLSDTLTGLSDIRLLQLRAHISLL